jgi:hypothetical protein
MPRYECADTPQPPNFREHPLLKLSEKGFEYCSKREFGRYTEGKMAERSLFGAP